MRYFREGEVDGKKKERSKILGENSRIGLFSEKFKI